VNARIVANVRSEVAKVMHLSGKALAPEVAALIAALSIEERAKLRLLAVLVVRATSPQ
jgi:hypothetical protein